MYIDKWCKIAKCCVFLIMIHDFTAKHTILYVYDVLWMLLKSGQSQLQSNQIVLVS